MVRDVSAKLTSLWFNDQTCNTFNMPKGRGPELPHLIPVWIGGVGVVLEGQGREL